MATVVRLKRRRDEDPMEILYLACKKQRHHDKENSTNVSSNLANLFKFAGTVNSKDARISKPVREAIRKDKLEKEYKQHQINILGEVKSQSRLQKRQQSKQGRYKVIAKHRTLELDKLDTIDTIKEERIEQVNENNEKVSEEDCPSIENICQICQKTFNPKRGELLNCKCEQKDKRKGKTAENNPIEFKIKSNGENKSKETVINGKCGKVLIDTDTGVDNGELAHNGMSGEHTSRVECSHKDEVPKTDTSESAERMFCLVDMESDSGLSYESMIQNSSTDTITCNSEPMVREIVSERGNDEDYVYDLYYTNSRDFDFQMFEHDLTFETFNNNLMYDGEMLGDELENAGEDDNDDENEESNWRNDYPEEDPHFIENQEAEYHYGNDMEEYNTFESETGNQLADWMSWRCNLEDGDELLSDDELVEQYEASGGPSYDAYYRRVHKEMGQEEENSDEKSDVE